MIKTSENSDGPRSANPRPSETNHLSDEKGSTTIMAQTDDTREWYGHHLSWCTDYDGGPHDASTPYCERQMGGIEAVTEPDWQRAQLWVSNIHAFVHGTFTWAQHVAFEKHRNGIQLSVLTANPGAKYYPWTETLINIPSGAARTLAAQLIAAADISDGIDRPVRHG